MKKVFKVVLKKLKNDDWVTVFECDNVEISDMNGVLTGHIDHKELLPFAIIKDLEVHGMAACQCGTIGISYSIYLNKDIN